MRKLIIGSALTAAVVGGSFAVAAVNPLGLAGAQPADEQEAPAPAGARQGPPRILDESLDELVAEGTLDQADADAVRAKVRARIDERGGRGEGRWRGRGHHGAVLRESADEVAGVLGLSTDDLRTALGDGTTLNELAARQGVDPAAVRQVLLDGITARIDEAVAGGRLDADRAKAAEQRAAEAVDRLMEEGGLRGRGPR